MTCRTRAVYALLVVLAGALLAWSKLPLKLPVTCAFRRVTGFPCASCGLTHATCALARGEFRQAEQFNFAAIPLAMLGGLVVVGLVLELWTNRPWLGPVWARWKTVVTLLIVGLLGAAWVFHFVPLPYLYGGPPGMPGG